LTFTCAIHRQHRLGLTAVKVHSSVAVLPEHCQPGFSTSFFC